MNKKLLTLAVAGALAIGSGAAIADVKLYGKFNMNINGGDGIGTDTTTGEDTLDLDANGSRLGIRAEDDLGNNMKAWIWSEWKMDPADGVTANQFVNRDTLVGLTGGFGTLAAGNAGSPYKGFVGGLDLFGDTIGDHNTYGVLNPAGPAVSYSNKFDAVSLALAYAPDNGTEGKNGMHGSLSYSSGAMMLGVAFTSSNAAESAAAPNDETQTGMALGVSWKLDNLKLLALYETASNVGNTDGNDETTLGIGAALSSGDNTFKAQYYTTDADDESEGDLIALGMDRSLSKNTSVGVVFANKSPQASGADDLSQYSVGMTVKF